MAEVRLKTELCEYVCNINIHVQLYIYNYMHENIRTITFEQCFKVSATFYKYQLQFFKNSNYGYYSHLTNNNSIFALYLHIKNRLIK